LDSDLNSWADAMGWPSTPSSITRTRLARPFYTLQVATPGRFRVAACMGGSLWPSSTPLDTPGRTPLLGLDHGIKGIKEGRQWRSEATRVSNGVEEGQRLAAL
jgi:hypothetical protein